MAGSPILEARSCDAPPTASETDWRKAGVTHATAQHLMVRSLIERDPQTAPSRNLDSRSPSTTSALAPLREGDRTSRQKGRNRCC